jgi:hypothetical protein
MALNQETDNLKNYIKTHVGDLLYEQIAPNLSNLVVATTKYVTEVLQEKLPAASQKIVSLLEGWLKQKGYYLSQTERDFAIGSIRNIHEIKTGAISMPGVAPVVPPAPVTEDKPVFVASAEQVEVVPPRKKKFKLLKIFSKKAKKDTTPVAAV